MTQLSPNFSLEELTRSQASLRLGIDNQPNEEQLANLTRLANDLLEPVRALLGFPLHIDSGFRCPQVNAAVGSTASHSAHLDGRAADVIPVGMDLKKAFDLIRQGIIFDQLIIECNAWLHIAVATEGAHPRRQALVASGSPGHWTYEVAP